MRMLKQREDTKLQEIEPDQWKRYTASDNAAKLKPGQSVSVPDLIDWPIN